MFGKELDERVGNILSVDDDCVIRGGSLYVLENPIAVKHYLLRSFDGFGSRRQLTWR